MNREAKPALAWDLLILTLALFGLAINVLLLARRFSDTAAGIAGCGSGTCGEVLDSRWAVIFSVPVTVFGAVVYAGLMMSLMERFRGMFRPLLGAILGAAAWFIFVQAVLLGKFCPWCMTAHCVGIAVFGLGVIRISTAAGLVATLKNTGFWALTAFLGIGLLQVYGPVSATHRIDETPRVRATAAVHERGEGRKVVFDGGGKTFNVATLPRCGPLGAKHVLVEYFDYQCPACRTMSGFLTAFADKHPADVAVLLLPVPLDGVCNPHVPAGGEHPGSCEIARIALAVWRMNPEAFPSWHRTVMADPTTESARRMALEFMRPERLEAALSDPWIHDMIRADIADWQEFSTGTAKLPKLLIRDTRILHGLPSGEADFIRVMEQELGLQ